MHFRPMIVKIHGDPHLSSQNMGDETQIIQEEVESQVKNLLYHRALIFIGYGGNDRGL